ncbi:MAG: phytanoyl-CoA dioxygenase family protein [Saprospiraceae bacterium]|nr:phytanoyl-CoA dioxygenase family protein [Saprospiraceae bacterium]
MTEFCTPDDINLDAFADLCQQSVDRNDFPLATSVRQNVVIYQGEKLTAALEDDDEKKKVKGELHHCLKNGPGVFAIQDFYSDRNILDRSTQIFEEIIAREKVNRSIVGDHFAKVGENERIWNSFQKVAERDPHAFIAYYKNPLFAIVSESWLGPGYQMTAQVNIVKPGGRAQTAHRDFHLGFQSDDLVQQFPLPLQIASQYLTLQGAIAHTDMPEETGPTLLLPFSQQYEMGYLAWRDEAFKQYFAKNAVQLNLKKGDAIFFSPALFHAAGANRSSNDRIANLVQISAAFGKPMESINKYKMMKMIYPVLLENIGRRSISQRELATIIAIVADRYSFPTNLDIVPPQGGHAPETAHQLLKRAICEKWPYNQFEAAVDKHARDRQA